ncbi:MAG TPA: TIGR03000 domain-containing protein [Gemmataceae bacterium]|nr:TIGR03000 domain-containing protein [Gemmataceae bacterium]
MLRKLTVLTLAAALVVGGANTAFAQRGGRGGGAGRVGGGARVGGGRGWSGGGYRGGYGGYHDDHHNNWGGFGTGLAIGAGLGYLNGYGGYGYGGYGYGSPGYYSDPGYYSTAPVYVDPGYTNGVVVPSMSGAMNNGYMAAYPQQAQNTAMINMHVPADAKVFFGNTEGSSAQTGPERHFVSPPLDPGSNYQYQLRAQWMQNGQMVDRTRTVDVHANQTVNVDFTQDQSH